MKPPAQIADLHLQFVKKSDRAEVTQPAEDLVSTAPHLLIREAVAAEVVIILFAIIALIFDAPLEEIANPYHTPNPAKAPWYFLGLQELLHYFPPVVAGVLIPTLVVIALVVIPYFGVNVKPRSVSSLDRGRVTLWATLLVIAIAGTLLPFACWPLMALTMFMYAGIMMSAWGTNSRAKKLGRLTIPDWVVIWFVASAFILTVIGTFFRGPGWMWVWPWKTGIY